MILFCASSEKITERAPWIAQLRKYTVDDSFSTAILISPRHAIALSTELIDYQWEQHTKYNSNKWAYEYNFDHFVNNEKEPYDARECKNNVIEFSKKHIFNLYIRLYCPGCNYFNEVFSNVTSVHFFGVCKPGKRPQFLALLEMSTSSVDGDKHQMPSSPMPICLAQSDVKAGEAVEEHYTGKGRSGAYHLEPHIATLKESNSSKLVTVGCQNPSYEYMSVCVYSNCSFNKGGFVKKIDGKHTLLGMNSDPAGLPRTCDLPDNAVSVAFFKDKICEYSGVCKGAMEEPAKEESTDNDASTAIPRSIIPILVILISILIFRF
ncbi:hypothetical protein CRE_06324 [Caenorhabditis remanei]|uniref:PH domain-containing protein n=1 Tax=Caenorhabditis remanei TaxID=31234 RepID=E3M1D0_CAERE|nr:hypothetical protein CRE_06324 [Caenorhabditis remanei]